MIGKPYRRHVVETVYLTDGELARMLDSRAATTATFVGTAPCASGGLKLIWAMDMVPDEATLRIYEIVSPGPPEAAGVDFADHYKARCYDRLRDLLYGPMPETKSDDESTATKLARAVGALTRLRDLNKGPDQASGEYRCTEAAAIADRALKDIGR